MAYFLVRPVPTEWLLQNARFLRFVDDYARVESLMTRWSSQLPDPADITFFWKVAAKRPYAYLSEADVQSFTELYSPAIIESCVARVKTILLSPCSVELKQRALEDPLRVGEFLYGMVTLALTSSGPSLCVCTFGDTKESALQTAEAAFRQLSRLREVDAIGPVQGVCTFLCSEERQATRLAEFNRTLDAFRWLANFERTVAKEKLDRELFRGFLKNARVTSEGGEKPQSVTLQQSTLRMLGLKSIEKFFFIHQPSGYLCVQRVLPAPGVSLAATRDCILDKLKPSYIDAVVTSPEYFTEQYYFLLRLSFLTVVGIWMVGILAVLMISSVQYVVARVLFGKEADMHVRCFYAAPGYRAYLAECGLEKCEDFVDIESIAAQEGAGAEIEVTPVRIHRIHPGGAGRRIDLVRVPPRDSMPALWRDTGECVLYLKRASGYQVKAVRNEYGNIIKMRGKGVPMPPLVAYGESRRRGQRRAFLVVAGLKGYEALYDWQIAAARDMPASEREKIKGPLLAEIARITKMCQANRFYNIAWLAKHVFFRILPNGTLRVRIIDLEAARGGTVGAWLKAALCPGWKGRRRVRDFALLNTQLLMEVFSLRDRLRGYKQYTQRQELTKKDKRVIAAIERRSRKRGYFQYSPKVNGMSVNLAEYYRMEHSRAHSFDEFMALAGERTVTRKRERTVVTLNVDGDTWYLKRHVKGSFFASLREMIRYGKPMTNARLEWRAIGELTALGIRTVPPLAMGEKFRVKFWEKSSFLLTAELAGGQSLESLLARGVSMPFAARKELAERVAGLARRLHTAGLSHRDFYLGHIYIAGTLAGSYRLHLLDLQRVRPGARLYNRWSVKDVSALLFSSLALPGITRSDRMRFLFNYLRIRTLDMRTKRFLYRVLAKNDRIARHTKKLLARRRARGELPPLPDSTKG